MAPNKENATSARKPRSRLSLPAGFFSKRTKTAKDDVVINKTQELKPPTTPGAARKSLPAHSPTTPGAARKSLPAHSPTTPGAARKSLPAHSPTTPGAARKSLPAHSGVPIPEKMKKLMAHNPKNNIDDWIWKILKYDKQNSKAKPKPDE